jgi:hypothetical protein
MIVARDWGKMDTREILASIEVALKTLRDRDIDQSDLKYLSLLLSDCAILLGEKIQ